MKNRVSINIKYTQIKKINQLNSFIEQLQLHGTT